MYFHAIIEIEDLSKKEKESNFTLIFRAEVQLYFNAFDMQHRLFTVK